MALPLRGHLRKALKRSVQRKEREGRMESSPSLPKRLLQKAIRGSRSETTSTRGCQRWRMQGNAIAFACWWR